MSGIMGAQARKYKGLPADKLIASLCGFVIIARQTMLIG